MTGYNPDLHITAAELRSAGVDIPEHIPDAAYMVRSGWRADVEKVSVVDNRIHTTLRMEPIEPMYWPEHEP